MTKIPHMQPNQLTPGLLAQVGTSLGQSICPSMIVGVAIQEGCIELVLDLVSVAGEDGRDPDIDVDPTQHSEFVDPSVWLQHLRVPPPAGTEVLTQACGR